MLKKKRPPLPEPSRLDVLSQTDLFNSLEAHMMNASHQFKMFQQSGDPEMALARLEDHLMNADAIAKALRRKVAAAPNV
jgi:hypothetical protein